MADRTFKIRGTVDKSTIGKLLDWLKVCHAEQPILPVLIQIDITDTSGNYEIAIGLYEQLKSIPHPPIHTFAGLDTWYTGALIFLIGDERRISPALTMRLEWNRTTAAFISERTGKSVQELWGTLASNPLLNPERVRELGIATDKPEEVHRLRLSTE